jgi:hypothetical protein
MAGLDPAIHLLRENSFSKVMMDPRVKPGGDDWSSLQKEKSRLAAGLSCSR